MRSPYLFAGVSPFERGRELARRALRDTGSLSQIRADEFQIVRMADGRYLVVLPGVTDLSSPGLGLSGVHRSVRDLDRHAYPSSRTTSVADNRYARMVIEAMAVAGVPVGSDVVIVGHSFGADTALDLAAAAGFNGPGGYRVTHVVAAGYHSGPQLEHVPVGTEVLVLQNRRDLAVIAEAISGAHVTDAIEARREAIGDLLAWDLSGVVLGAGRALYHDAGVAIAAADHTVDRAGDLVDVALGAATDDAARVIDGASDFVTLEPGVRSPRPGQVVAVFDGGAVGGGHHQVNYSEYLDGADDPAVVAFLTSLGASAALAGTAYAVDVSVPIPDAPARPRPRVETEET